VAFGVLAVLRDTGRGPMPCQRSHAGLLVAVTRSNARCHVAGKPRSAGVIAGRRVSLSGQGHRAEPVKSNYQLIDSCHYSALTGPGQGRHRAVRHCCIEAKRVLAVHQEGGKTLRSPG